MRLRARDAGGPSRPQFAQYKVLAKRTFDAGQQHQSDCVQNPYVDKFFFKTFHLDAGRYYMTGTPSGVGTFRDPPIYMKDGDEIIVEIEHIGRLANRCKVNG